MSLLSLYLLLLCISTSCFRRKEINTEYKKKFQPFSQYDYIEGKFTRKKEEEVIPVPLLLPNMQQSDSWYKEVLELRKKAGEYKVDLLRFKFCFHVKITIQN